MEGETAHALPQRYISSALPADAAAVALVWPCCSAAIQQPPIFPTHHAVGHLQQVLLLLPHLEAVEVEGLTPEAIGALLPAWQEALQQRGHQGCTIAGEGGGLRFARVAE